VRVQVGIVQRVEFAAYAGKVLLPEHAPCSAALGAGTVPFAGAGAAEAEAGAAAAAAAVVAEAEGSGVVFAPRACRAESGETDWATCR